MQKIDRASPVVVKHLTIGKPIQHVSDQRLILFPALLQRRFGIFAVRDVTGYSGDDCLSAIIGSARHVIGKPVTLTKDVINSVLQFDLLSAEGSLDGLVYFRQMIGMNGVVPESRVGPQVTGRISKHRPNLRRVVVVVCLPIGKTVEDVRDIIDEVFIAFLALS